MAKIKTVYGHDGTKNVQLTMQYSAREEVFSVVLPSYVADAIGISEVEEGTQSRCEAELKKAFDLYVKANRQVRKVIVTELKTNPSGDRWKNKVSHFDPVVGLTFSAGVFEETTYLSEGKTTVRHVLLESRIPDSYELRSYDSRYSGKRVIPYTEDAELGICALIAAIEAAAKKLENLFSGTDASVANILEAAATQSLQLPSGLGE